MGFGNVTGCSSIRDYESAVRHFERTPKPKGTAWSDHTRPLNDARKWHYRLERHDGYYDVCLYHTTMARYHKPQPDGSYQVNYSWDSRTTSHQFSWNVLGVTDSAMRFQTQAHQKVYVPIDSISNTILWFDKDWHLDLTRSSHVPIARRVLSQETRDWRKALRSNLSNIAALLSFTNPLEGYHPDEDDGAPFNKHSSIKVSARQRMLQDLKYAKVDLSLPHTLNEYVVEALRKIHVLSAQMLADTRAYHANPPSRYSWRTPAKVVPYVEPTPQEITRSWYAALTSKTCPLWEQTTKVPLPAFPTELPASWTF